MKYFYLFILFQVFHASWECPLDCSQVNCVQGFSPFKCPDETMFVNNAALCGCCPGCVKFKSKYAFSLQTFNLTVDNLLQFYFLEPDESCKGQTSVTFDVKNYYSTKMYYFSTETTPIVATEDCAPGLSCVNTKCTQCKYFPVPNS